MWSSLSRDREPDQTQADSYAALLVKLIYMGADVHALDSHQETPFTKLARRGCQAHDDFELFRRLCARWSEVLTRSELALSDYVEVENELQLRAADPLRARKTNMPYIIRLLLLQDSRLTLELKYCRPLDVMEYCPPPGAWEVDSQIPRYIYWHPYEAQDMELGFFSQKVKTVYIYSNFRSIELAAPSSDLFYSEGEIKQRWQTLFARTQDDHGQVATLLRQYEKTCGLSTRLGRRRAVSAPLPTTAVEDDYFNPGPFRVSLWARTSISDVHRCVFDAKWKTQYGVELNVPRLQCMQGRCHSTWRYDFESHRHWEADLFEDLDKADVALRYADRFHPQLRPIFEAEFEKTRRWAELEEDTFTETEFEE